MLRKRDIVNGALFDLRVSDAVESPAAEDYDVCAARYDALHAALRDLGLCYWPNTDDNTEEIPDALEIPLTLLLSARCARMFGKEEGSEAGDDGRPIPQSVFAMRAIRKHIAKKPSGEPTPFSSY